MDVPSSKEAQIPNSKQMVLEIGSPNAYKPPGIIVMRMKSPIVFFVLFFLAFSVKSQPDFAAALNYVAPAGYGVYELNHDPGDNPFSGEGPGFMYLAGDSEIRFQIAIVRFSIGRGKAIEFLSTSPSDLRDDLMAEYRGKFPQVNPAVTYELGGLSTTSLTASRPSGGRPSFFQFNWVQLETNIVLKITATADNPDAFKTATNSLQSLKIDKVKLFEALQPKKPEVTAEHLEKVDIGYVAVRRGNGNSGRVAAFIFHCTNKTFSFTVFDNGDPARPIRQVVPWLLKFQSNQNPQVLRAAVIEIARQGSTDYFERTCGFVIETNTAIVDQLQEDRFRPPASFHMLYWSESQEPAGFEKTAEYKVNATLLIRKVVF